MGAAGRRRAGPVRLLAVVLLLSLVFPVMQVNASSTKEKLDKAKEDKKQTENQKDAVEDTIDDMEGAKSSLQGELSNLTQQLTETSNQLEEIESRIISKNDEIAQTQQELEEAKATEKWQYESLKKRIQYMYEKRNNAYLDMLFNSTSFGEFLNRNEYISQIAAYDQKMMAQFEETRENIEATEAQLEQEKAELDQLKADAQTQHHKVSGLVNSTKGTISTYSNQISQAEGQAAALEAQIAEQNANIAALQKQLQEEMAKSRLAKNSTWRNISEVTFAEDDRYLLANLIYCEAGGESYEGQVAVGAVVMNRVLSSVYPNTVSGVIYQRRQFEPVATGRLALALAQNKATASCYKAADEAMTGYTNVGTCVYFRTPIPGLVGQQIGGHIFY